MIHGVKRIFFDRILNNSFNKIQIVIRRVGASPVFTISCLLNNIYLSGFPKNFAQCLYGICEYNYTTCKIEVYSVVVEQIQILFELQRKQKTKATHLEKKKTGDCNFGVKK